MSTFDPRFQLAQGGDSVRVAVQRLSDLSLMALYELARALEDATRADELLEGFKVGALATTLQDASGSLCLADIRARQSALERPFDGQAERDELLDGITQAVASRKADEARTLLSLLLERFPGDSLVSVAAGFVHQTSGDLAEARQCFVRAQSPEADAGLKADALFLQAVVTGHMGEVDFAVNLLERAAVTEESLAETWTRPVARARYEQARFIALRLDDGSLGGEHAERCRRALLGAVESNGYFFGPAYVDPAFGVLEGLRNELNDRFNALSIESNLVANAGGPLMRDLQVKRLVDYDTLQRAREVFQARGYFSRSRLMSVGVRTVVKLREAAAAGLATRLEAAIKARDEGHALAESTRRRGQELAAVEISHGAQATRALDLRAYSMRQTMSDRFRLDEALEPQYERLALEAREARNGRFTKIAVAASVLLLAAVVLVPGALGKIIGALVFACAAAWLLSAEHRRYGLALDQLDGELERAREQIRGASALEESSARTAQQSQAQSQAVRRQAEGDRQLSLERVGERFADERSEVRRCVDVLVEANTRFFRAIDGASLPEARFTPPDIDEGARPD